jgi:hypothetical protein
MGKATVFAKTSLNRKSFMNHLIGSRAKKGSNHRTIFSAV